MRSKFGKTLKNLKKRKTPDLNEIPAEIFQNIGEKGLAEIMRQGKVLNDFRKSVIVTFPKVRADKCKNFRTIILLFHASKISIEILYRRIESNTEVKQGEYQFRFRKSRNIIETILH